MVRIFFLSLLISSTSLAQIVKVDLKLDTMTGRITSYKKDQLEKMLLDSAIYYCKKHCEILGSPARFYSKAYCADSIKADYSLSLLVRDTVSSYKKLDRVESVHALSEFLEEKNEKAIPNKGGAGWSYLVIEKDKMKNPEKESIVQLGNSTVEEPKVIHTYFGVLITEARGMVDECMPMSLDMKLKSRNISREQLNDYESYRDVVVEFEAVDLSMDSADVARVEVLIDNAFFVRQDFHYRVHGKKKKYFNYYFSARSGNNNETPLVDNPLTVRFVLMKSDTNQYRLVAGHKNENEVFKISDSKEVYFSKKDLNVFPSKINFMIYWEVNRLTLSYKYLD